MYASHTYSHPTCVDEPISSDHVTTQTNIPSIFSALVSLETTILLPTHG